MKELVLAIGLSLILILTIIVGYYAINQIGCWIKRHTGTERAKELERENYELKRKLAIAKGGLAYITTGAEAPVDEAQSVLDKIE